MQGLTTGSRYGLVVAVLLLGACAQQAPLMRPPPPELAKIEPGPVIAPAADPDETDPMADIAGDRMLPALAGAVERYDCKVGSEDLQARMALEARGGQVASFAYYSKWRPRTCSLDMQRDAPFTKWRLTADGATRVQTLHGAFLIRALPDAWEVEFFDVERQEFCGMDGYTNGTMVIKRSNVPECSVAGLLDRDEVAPTGLAGAPAADRDAAPPQAQLSCDEGSGELCGLALYPATVGY